MGGRKGGLLCRCNKAPLTKLMESYHFHPERKGVNDGIKADLYSLRYTSVEEAVRRNKSCMGHGTWFTKLYIEVAYRIVPVHPEDQHLLGMGWYGVDTAPPVSLRSAPKIFNSLSNGLQWILVKLGASVIHYLYDLMLYFSGEEEF